MGVLACMCLQVFPHEYQRAMAEAAAIKKAEEEQKAAIKAAGEAVLHQRWLLSSVNGNSPAHSSNVLSQLFCSVLCLHCLNLIYCLTSSVLQVLRVLMPLRN